MNFRNKENFKSKQKNTKKNTKSSLFYSKYFKTLRLDCKWLAFCRIIKDLGSLKLKLFKLTISYLIRPSELLMILIRTLIKFSKLFLLAHSNQQLEGLPATRKLVILVKSERQKNYPYIHTK